MTKGNAARFVQRLVNGAGTVSPGRCGAEKASAKRHVRLELGAALQPVKARVWVPMLQEVGQKYGEQKVGGGGG